MAQSEQARLISELLGKGYSVKDIAALTGRSSRYITLARDSTTQTGKNGKVTSGKGQNLVPALKAINEKGRLTPEQIPERRKGKGGKTANVRKGIKNITTKKGKERIAARVKNGPATLKRAINKAANAGAGVRWDINFKRVTTISDVTKLNAWVSGQLPDGWTAQTLADRINNPQPQEGDTWQAGDVNGALIAIALEQNESSVVSASGPQEYSLFTTE